MTTTNTAILVSRHILGTRLLHAGLAAAIVIQLASSQFMSPDDGGNSAFSVHQYSGLAAFLLVLGFWVFGAVRQRGTPMAELMPWFSGTRRAALWADIKAHAAALKSRRLPAHGDINPLASATHGLGLLLVTGMAVSGTLYYFVNAGDPDAGGLVGLAMVVHLNLAFLVWVYLIAHAGLAVISHFARTLLLSTMWSFKGAEK